MSLRLGQDVIYTDHYGVDRAAIVTAVWAQAGPDRPGTILDGKQCVVETDEDAPGCNLVYVSGEEAERDQYGRQIRRETSVVHQSRQSAHGNYWRHP